MLITNQSRFVMLSSSAAKIHHCPINMILTLIDKVLILPAPTISCQPLHCCCSLILQSETCWCWWSHWLERLKHFFVVIPSKALYNSCYHSNMLSCTLQATLSLKTFYWNQIIFIVSTDQVKQRRSWSTEVSVILSIDKLLRRRLFCVCKGREEENPLLTWDWLTDEEMILIGLIHFLCW